MGRRILIVDDEETICSALQFNLQAEGYDADVACSAEEVLASDVSGYDLILLDVMMGEISGIQLARILKTSRATAHIPIIFCTAKDTEEDMVSGLDLGADDYIVKPFSLRNVLARIRAVLRRTAANAGQAPDNDEVSFEGLRILPWKKACIVDGEEVALPKKEYEILLKLLGNRGKVFSREEILREIWPGESVVLERVVDVNVARLRQKIGRYGAYVRSRSGYGYGFLD